MNNQSYTTQGSKCIHSFTKGPRIGQQCTTRVNINRNNESSTPLCAKHARPTCSICLETVLQNTGVVTRCKHVFHTTCLEQVTNNSCPNCRAHLVSSKVVQPAEHPLVAVSNQPVGIVMLVTRLSDTDYGSSSLFVPRMSDTESGSSSSDDDYPDQDDHLDRDSHMKSSTKMLR